jgi:hypothetical protein
MSPPPHITSIWISRSDQPRSRSFCRNAVIHDCPSASLPVPTKAATRLVWTWAFAARGQPTAEATITLMNSRRLKFRPQVLDKVHRIGSNRPSERGATECPLWVKSRQVRCNSPCLLYPPKEDISLLVGMSAKGQSGHSMISSARKRKGPGIDSPMAFAPFKLTTN